MTRRLKAALLAASLALAPLVQIPAAHAVQPDEMLADPAMEARARAISKELRCLVCQNESIDDSNAPLAHDLRVLVRDRLKTGDSDEQAMRFITDRYGDYVLLRPPFKATTLVLWLGPFALLSIGAVGVVFYLRGRRGAALAAGGDTAPLTEEERRRLDALLADGAPGAKSGKEDL